MMPRIIPFNVMNHQHPPSRNFEDMLFLIYFYSYLQADNWYSSPKSKINLINDVTNDPILKLSSQKPPILSKYDFEGRVFLATSILVRAVKTGTRPNNYIEW